MFRRQTDSLWPHLRPFTTKRIIIIKTLKLISTNLCSKDLLGSMENCKNKRLCQNEVGAFYTQHTVSVLNRTFSLRYQWNPFIITWSTDFIKHLSAIPFPDTKYSHFPSKKTNRLICGNKMPTRCNRDFYYSPYCLLNMFRAPLCPSSGAQEYYTVVANCGISCCGFQVAGLVWSWGLYVRFAGCCSILQTGHITLSSTWKP